MTNQDEIILRAIRDYVTEGYQITDAKGTFIFCNNASSELNGLPLEARLGKNCFELQPDGALSIVLRTGRSVYGHICSTGNGLIMVANGFPIHDEQGRLIGAISEFTDKTSYIEMAARLAKNENKLKELEKKFRSLTEPSWSFEDLVGQHPAFLKCLNLARAAAESDATVLITGESGTGKELFAQAVHRASHRSRNPFIRVNCPAIPQPLLESELFGHEKGSFTGASTRRIGRFESADQGSIFLDEIGDLEYGLQAKLLSFLQLHEIERVGGNKAIPLDVRVIAATNQELENLISLGHFRRDLYYRLNVIRLHLPPLRERKSDIPLLFEHALRKNSDIPDARPLSKEALDLFLSYDWPGNVRELENAAARISLTHEQGPVTRAEAEAALSGSGGHSGTIPAVRPHARHAAAPSVPTPGTPGQVHGTRSLNPGARGNISPDRRTAGPPLTLRALEEHAILDALDRHGTSLAGKKAAAAELGISLSGLYKKLSDMRT